MPATVLQSMKTIDVKMDMLQMGASCYMEEITNLGSKLYGLQTFHYW